MEVLNQELAKRNAATQEKRFQDWCAELDRLPTNYVPQLKENFKPDIELQPKRWLGHAMDIIESAHVTARVQLMGGVQGEAFSSFLPYPIFQMGAETFLKGMLLCRFTQCRRVAQNSYVNPATRQRYLRRLKNYGHDLLKLIRHLRRISPYRCDDTARKFLRRVEAITRCYYHPLYEADRGSWAAARYPKRFYDDHAHTAGADAMKSFPQQSSVLRLFRDMDRHLDEHWQITCGLAKRRGSRRPD